MTDPGTAPERGRVESRRGPPGERGGFSAELTEVTGEEVLVVQGYGELDLANRYQFQQAIARGLQSRRGTGSMTPRDGHRLVIDLSGVTFLGATIIAEVVEQAQRTPRRQHPPRLVVGRQGMLNRLSAILALSEVFDIYEDLDEAMAESSPH